MNEEQIKERLRVSFLPPYQTLILKNVKELMPQLDDDVSVHKLLLKLETVLFDTQTSYDIEKIHSTVGLKLITLIVDYGFVGDICDLSVHIYGRPYLKMEV